MRVLMFGLFLFFGTTVAAYAQRTANNERTGWYSNNPWMVAVIAAVIIVLVLVGIFLMVRRKI